MSRKFSLASLLRLRQIGERQAARAVAEANQAVRAHTLQREQTLQELHDSANDPVDSATLLAIAAARSAGRSALADLQALEAQLDEDRELAAEAYRAQRRGVKALEKLEARHHQAVQHADLAREQHLLDDLAGTARGRTRQ
ncbi:flagellar export protein FliJ [Arthrobacter sp. AG1021]|uniref:flagellar export protein FliJ n=1 Tax=Arthrobacter sp. AG1021 TaxID=2183908 RepID=UPI000F145CEF|nr:flagellar FliJ family protein [Arthrobacter sp. AG1021]RKS19451.1 flagellar export protein FliJ [Arthrobacter sp. AG1021]